MCAEMLLRSVAFHGLGVEAVKAVELIKRNIDTSLRLIADLLDLERIEGGKINLKLEEHSLCQIIQEVVEGFAPVALAKVVILKHVPVNPSGHILCDKDRVVQVLSNHIGNSLKFTPSGGSIVASTNFGENEVQVSIADTGPGIPPEKKSQIFERYAQIGVSNRTGLGLGLYISKMLIEAHHGRLWVSSKLGVGSTFHFTIPRGGEAQ